MCGLWPKVTNINLRIKAKHHAYLQTLTKHLQSFKKIQVKLQEELCSQDTQCVYALSPKIVYALSPKMIKSELQKSDKS